MDGENRSEGAVEIKDSDHLKLPPTNVLTPYFNNGQRGTRQVSCWVQAGGSEVFRMSMVTAPCIDRTEVALYSCR